jgi:tetratricopeptide (TPR) repeat protein
VTAAAALAVAAWLAAADGAAPDAAVAPDDDGTAAPVAAPHPSAAASAAGPSAASSPGPASSAARAGARADHAQGITLLRAGQVDEAAALFASAVERDPGNVTYATDLGFALGKLGRRAEAEAVLRGAIDKDPHRFYAYVNLADILASDPGRWERRDALVAFLDKGLDALKDDVKGRFNLLLGVAGFERSVGRTAAARRRLQPLLAPEATPPLTRAQRKRVLDALDAIALDERAHALEDWPSPEIAAADAAAADGAARALERGRLEEARAAIDPLARRYPSWQRARLLRARVLEGLGRVDEATRDLEIAVNLAPSSAEAWRALGRLLALHGGALEAERADEALRNALTLEPAWTDLRELRAQIARRRAALSVAPPPARGAGPSEKARALYQEAEEWIDVGDPAGLGRDLLQQALADSPGFVAAALSMYALSGAVPPATVAALHDDGPALWALASGVRKLGKGQAADALVRPWIDRAVELDVQEARFARALSRAAAGDRDGALEDLVDYVSREPSPEHLEEARALRAGLGGEAGARAGARQPPELLARIRLLEDRPDAALRALGGTCARGLPADRLAALGLVYEYADQRAAARACYELAVTEGKPADPATLARLARLDARLPDIELRAADPKPLGRAAERGIAAAEWARARLAALDGDEAAELAAAERALALAAGGSSAGITAADGWLPEARATRDRLAAARRDAARARRDRQRWAALGGIALVAWALAVVARRRFGGWTVAGVLRRRPGLFPELARTVGELRHDVLKHRAGVLGMLADPAAPRAEIARALTEPRPTSAMVAALYDRLAQAARGQGTSLRPLPREPVFGALARDLARAEGLLGRADSADGHLVVAELLAIDARLRGAHADALGELLQLGPRTRLDAAALSSWIDAVEASARQAGGGWAAPGLALADLAVDFPVEQDALAAIFANLLRNAQAAVAGQPDPRVVVRVDRERDVTGRQAVSLLVGDSAAAQLTEEAIEARESGRGLAIVRDLVRQWRGDIVVRPEGAPLSKLVGARFPQ